MQVYLDNSATTQPSPGVRKRMAEWMESGWYNPSALYKPAMEAQKRLEETRRLCLEAAGAPGQRVIFTSGGTEADNLALLGYLKGKRKPGRILVSALEHPAVSACLEEIRRMGHQTEEIPAEREGRIDLKRLESQLDDQVLMIAVMQVNNETGVIQPIREIARLRDRLCPGAAIHVDGVQGFLHVETDFSGWGIQSYALSGHKIHAMKGIGALITAKNHTLKPLLFGGGQEGQLRSGTENSCGIESLGEAIREYDPAANERMRGLKLRFWEKVKQRIPEALRNGTEDEDWLAPHILNLALPPVRSQTLLFALEGDGIYVSAGSACASRKQKISPVLKAMGIATERADCSLRFSLSPMNTEEEMDYAAERLVFHYEMLKKYTRR